MEAIEKKGNFFYEIRIWMNVYTNIFSKEFHLIIQRAVSELVERKKPLLIK